MRIEARQRLWVDSGHRTTVNTALASYEIDSGIFQNIEKMKDLGKAAKDKLKSGLKGQIDHVSRNLKVTKEAAMLAYEEPRMANVLQAVGYSTATLYGLFVQANHAAHHGAFTVLAHIVGHEALHKGAHKLGHNERVKKVDAVLDKYPLIKKLSGPAIAGMLLYGYCLAPLNKLSDWDLSNVTKAMKGEYTAADLVTSSEVVSLAASVASGHAFSLATMVESAGTLTVALAANAIVHSNNPKLQAVGKKIQATVDKFRAAKSPMQDIAESKDYKGPSIENEKEQKDEHTPNSGGDWFHKLSKDKQKEYLDKHPNSIFHKVHGSHSKGNSMKVEAKQRLRASSEFKYGLVNRPPGIGAVPKNYVHYDPENQGIDGVRHGILTYDRHLSDSEVKQYELLPLSGKDGKPLEVPKFPKAVIRKAQEAIDSLNYLKSEDPSEYADEILGLNATLDIFRKYAKSKHLDADKALKELGL